MLFLDPIHFTDEEWHYDPPPFLHLELYVGFVYELQYVIVFTCHVVNH